METSEIFELLERFDRSTLSEIIISKGDLTVTLRKPAASAEPADEPRSASATASAPHAASNHRKPVAGEQESPLPVEQDGEMITSPIVGTFYRSPSPDSPPFVEPGQEVGKGQTICIIEAMKVMNELQADFDCEIVDVLVENGTMIEFGTPLFSVTR